MHESGAIVAWAWACFGRYLGPVALATVLVACGGAAPRASPPDLPFAAAPVVPRDAAAHQSPHLLLGVPNDGDARDDVLLDHRVYVASYHPERHVPNWVAWRLEREDLGAAERAHEFRADPDLPFGLYRTTPRDYARSGYDRGHLCPSADRTRDATDNALTFFMTNVQPQLHELNAGPWEQLEVYARELVRGADVELYIVAGGVFADVPLTIGLDVAVPLASYKIVCVLARGQRLNDVSPSTTLFAVAMPNTKGVGRRPWTDFLVSVDAIERQSGYDFMPAIAEPLQAVLESRVAAAREFL